METTVTAPLNALSNFERETHFNIMADDRSKVHVFSDDPVWIARLDKIATGVLSGTGKKYELRIDQLHVRKGKKTMSDAQKAQLSTRMAQLRQSQRTT